MHTTDQPTNNMHPQVLPPGLPTAGTRPLPVPVELFQLPSLAAILNLDTWHGVLDEADRRTLRALLPNQVRLCVSCVCVVCHVPLMVVCAMRARAL